MVPKLDIKNKIPLRIEGSVPTSIDFKKQNNILIISKDQSYLTHAIHKFPAKFFPELPRFLINKYSYKTDIVLDPMCGSGTVILESALNGRSAIGVDIDPLAKLVSKVKTTPLQYAILSDAREYLKNMLNSSKLNLESIEIPSFNYRDNWFKPFVLKELALIKKSITLIPEQKTFKEYSIKQINDLKEFLLVIFSSIVRDVSNADPHCTRTVIRKKLVKKIGPGDTINKFFTNLEKQIKGMNELSAFAQNNKIDVKISNNSDARKLDIEDGTIGLAVTSPPYANAVDYPRTHQLELYWLGLVNTPLSSLKRNYIGTETVFSNEYNTMPNSDYSSLNSLIESVYQKDPRRAYILFRFYMDIQKNLQEVYRVLKPGKRYCLVIGNNTVRGHYVNSHEIITEIALSKAVGFKLETYFHSCLINHFIKIPRKERMPGEWILVFKKPI